MTNKKLTEEQQSQKQLEKYATQPNYGGKLWKAFVADNKAAEAELKKSVPTKNFDMDKHVIETLNKFEKPTYPTQATPEAVGKLAESLERHRQQTGEMSTWDVMKATAKTPQEKKEIRDIIKEDYKKHGAKNMADSDLRWIGKAKSQQSIKDFKIDAGGISNSINNFLRTTRQNVPVAPPEKQRDPDLNLGLGSILGETYDS